MPPIKLPSSSQLPSPQLKSNFRMCLPRLSFGGYIFPCKTPTRILPGHDDFTLKFSIFQKVGAIDFGVF